jgi:hypothetical protein
VAGYTLTGALPREYQGVLPSPRETGEKLAGLIGALGPGEAPTEAGGG